MNQGGRQQNPRPAPQKYNNFDQASRPGQNDRSTRGVLNQARGGAKAQNFGTNSRQGGMGAADSNATGHQFFDNQREFDEKRVEGRAAHMTKKRQYQDDDKSLDGF